jgi:hypothetical protein
MRDIITNLRSQVPVTVFSLGTHGNWNDLAATGANVLGIDWQFSLAEARRILPENIGIQGNLNPALLAEATPEKVSAETNRLLAGNARAQRLHFQPRPRCAADGKTGKYRRLGRDCEEFQMSTLKVDLDLVQKYNVAGPALHELSACDEIHRRIQVAGTRRKNFREQRNPARPLDLFSHPLLRNALLVLRLHDGHHQRSRARLALSGLSGKGSRADGRTIESQTQSRPTPLGRRLADVSDP